MFYCEECRVNNGWFNSFMRSYGRCEMCGCIGECYDMPSSSLPEFCPKGCVRVLEEM